MAGTTLKMLSESAQGDKKRAPRAEMMPASDMLRSLGVKLPEGIG